MALVEGELPLPRLKHAQQASEEKIVLQKAHRACAERVLIFDNDRFAPG